MVTTRRTSDARRASPGPTNARSTKSAPTRSIAPVSPLPSAGPCRQDNRKAGPVPRQAAQGVRQSDPPPDLRRLLQGNAPQAGIVRNCTIGNQDLMAHLIQEQGICPCMTEDSLEDPPAEKMNSQPATQATTQPVRKDNGGGFHPGTFGDLGFDCQLRALETVPPCHRTVHPIAWAPA